LGRPAHPAQNRPDARWVVNKPAFGYSVRVPRIIPREHQAPFRTLATLTNERFQALAAAISVTSPKHPSFEEHVAKELIQRDAISVTEEDTYVALMDMLITVYYSWVQEQHKITIDEFIEDVVSSDVADADATTPFEFDPELIGSRFRELMCLENLAIAGKTSILARFGARVFRDVYAVTDIRPIFGADRNVSPTFAALTHSFRFRVWDGEQQQFSEIFILLDDEDLAQLERAVEAAKQKSEMLRSKIDHKLTFVENS
jgi:hypothetical protein